MTIQQYKVFGMTCDHCAGAVKQEVSSIHGVTHVEVDLPNGAVVVTSKSGVLDAAVGEAVGEAGYEVSP